MIVKLVIDNREKDLKAVFPEAEFKNLDIGDIEIKYIDNSGNTQLFLLIERKTMCDVIASVNDGRYREQKKRLLESNIPRDKIMYLLEGHIDDIPGQMKTLFGMLINTVFRDKLKVIRFECIEETIYFIKRITEKIKNNDTSILDQTQNQEQSTESNNLEYLSTIKLKKKDNLSPYNCSLLQLSQIPGLSLPNAQVIIDKYKSIANLIKCYYEIEDEDKRYKLLSELETGSTTLTETGKKRKLGKVLSERIYKYLFNISIEEKN
jgi:ERCC4-type nuclease